MRIQQIGTIHTPFKEQKGTPIQPKMGKDIAGTIGIFDEFVPALRDLDGFSHIILLFYLHKSEGFNLEVVPYMDDKKRGLFATRAPRRPSPIGLSIVRLVKVDGNLLHIKDVDILDGTPLLDIKPYVPAFDEPQEIRTGWLEKRAHKASDKKADDRFDKSD